MKKIRIAIFILIIVPIKLIHACECSKVSHTFIDNISNYDFVGIVEVIGKDTISGEFDGYSLTEVRIINQFTKDYKGQKIKIIDSKGFECFVRLDYKEIGEKFIIKGFWKYAGNYIFNRAKKIDEEIMILSLCDESILKVVENDVIGNITINRYERNWKWKFFLKKISFGLINGKNKKITSQKKSLNFVKRLIVERLDNAIYNI